MTKTTNQNQGNGLKTVAVGVAAGVVGAAVGATVAAMSDKKTRNKVIDMASQAKEKGTQLLEAVQDSANDTEKQLSSKAEELKQKSKQAIADAKK